MRLEKVVNITGKIRLLTGLHIGAGKDSIEIGGLDLPIMKNPLNKAPFIPGSSIKGKMRSLLELVNVWESGQKRPKILLDGDPCSCGECLVCQIFGTHKASKTRQEYSKPTRVIVRDANLTEEFMQKHINGTLPMEIKYENIINRVTGVAEHPRPVERVPAGVEFDFSIALKIYEGDCADEFLSVIKKGLKLLELDALGGHSSRGSGQIQFYDTNGERLELVNIFED